jgi:hypothetical protein
MAKAKKPTASSAKSKKPASGKGFTPAAPLIDTSLAASTAARMIAARNAQATAASTSPAEKPHESAAFKQLKEGLSKSAPALGGSLSPIAGQNKSNLPHPFAKQVGRNQTFGADVNRSGVPRRTGGG